MATRVVDPVLLGEQMRPALRSERSCWGTAGRLVRHNPTAVLGFVVLATLCCMAVLAPLLAPYAPDGINPVERLQGPSWQHWFGTDSLGQDVLSRVIFG